MLPPTESSLPTPAYRLSSADESGGVYPPAEDTFLLMDALEADQELLRSLNPHLSLEIGCGSGVVTTFLHQLLTYPGAPTRLFSLAVDVNRQALDCTRRTLRANGISDERWEVVECDIDDPLLARLEGSVDVLLMNPPYVPTEREPTMDVEIAGDLYYAGGVEGRHLVDRLLPRVPKLLTPRRGVFYLVAMRENRMERVELPAGLKGRMVLERRCGIEHLSVWRFDLDGRGE